MNHLIYMYMTAVLYFPAPLKKERNEDHVIAGKVNNLLKWMSWLSDFCICLQVINRFYWDFPIKSGMYLHLILFNTCKDEND